EPRTRSSTSAPRSTGTRAATRGGGSSSSSASTRTPEEPVRRPAVDSRSECSDDRAASLQDLHEPVPGESRRTVSPEPDHLAVGDQGILDSFLGGWHDRLIGRVVVSPLNELALLGGSAAPVQSL